MFFMLENLTVDVYSQQFVSIVDSLYAFLSIFV